MPGRAAARPRALAPEAGVARRPAGHVAKLDIAAGRRAAPGCPSRSPRRATAAAARSSRARASAPACRPRSDRPSPRALEAPAVPDHRVEGREQPHLVAGHVAPRGRVLAGRPVPVDRRRSRPMASAPWRAPARRRVRSRHWRHDAAEPTITSMPSVAAGQRRVFGDGSRPARPARARGRLAARVAVARGVQTHAALAPRHAQQAAVVHAVEQLRAGVATSRRTSCALPCANAASTSRGCTTPRSRTKASTRGLRPARLRPRGARRARMHQRVHRARHEAVVDEEVLFDGQPGIAPLEVAGAVVAHAVAQRQVLRARRRADRVGLHEAEALDRARQRGRREQAARHRVAAQRVEVDRHGAIMPWLNVELPCVSRNALRRARRAESPALPPLAGSHHGPNPSATQPCCGMRPCGGNG